MFDIPDRVRRKAITVGALPWLDGLPAMVAGLEQEWGFRLGTIYTGATDAFVAEVVSEEFATAVVKFRVPRAGAASHEINVLRLCDGVGCARLLRHDEPRGVLLVERLGPTLSDLGLPHEQRLQILTAAASRVWRPAPDSGLPTGKQRAAELIDYATATWESLGRPCSAQAIDHAIACGSRRMEAHDDERAVLVHGDVHQWNALRSGPGFKLVDPDGLRAEAEFDLGVLMREDPLELLAGDPYARARLLARRTELDATAIWEWGVLERVTDGLMSATIDAQPLARQKLQAATLIAKDYPDSPR